MLNKVQLIVNNVVNKVEQCCEQSFERFEQSWTMFWTKLNNVEQCFEQRWTLKLPTRCFPLLPTLDPLLPPPPPSQHSLQARLLWNWFQKITTSDQQEQQGYMHTTLC